MALSFATVSVGGGFTVGILHHARLLLSPIKGLSGERLVAIEFGGVSVAAQRAWVLLVARVGDAGGAVVEEVLDVVRGVLETGRGAAGPVHQRMASAHALREPAVVIGRFQGLAAPSWPAPPGWTAGLGAGQVGARCRLRARAAAALCSLSVGRARALT